MLSIQAADPTGVPAIIRIRPHQRCKLTLAWNRSTWLTKVAMSPNTAPHWGHFSRAGGGDTILPPVAPPPVLPFPCRACPLAAAAATDDIGWLCGGRLVRVPPLLLVVVPPKPRPESKVLRGENVGDSGCADPWCALVRQNDRMMCRRGEE